MSITCDPVQRADLEQRLRDAVWAYDFQRTEGDLVDQETVDYVDEQIVREVQMTRDGRTGELSDQDLRDAYVIMMVALGWPVTGP